MEVRKNNTNGRSSTRLLAILIAVTALAVTVMVRIALADEDCGGENDSRSCPDRDCCSNKGSCGYGYLFCAPRYCHSQCWAVPSVPPAIEKIITKEVFEQMFPHRNDPSCAASNGFYDHSAFLAATHAFPLFGTQGDLETRKRELAAFFAQTAYETTDQTHQGQYDRGYCLINQVNRPQGSSYCNNTAAALWPCLREFYGRGPMQLRWNYNYGEASSDLKLDLIDYADAVAQNATLSFQTAIWFWMAQHYGTPSCHDVMIGQWAPTESDREGRRVPGFGIITNIITSANNIGKDQECGSGPNKNQDNRVGYYQHFCSILGVSPGDNLGCTYQNPFIYPPKGQSRLSFPPGQPTFSSVPQRRH